MQVKTIEIEYGLTVNLGNYSNAKPVVKLVAELAESDDTESSLDALIDLARRRVQEIADDELEQSGNEVKYSNESLYQVYSSDLRKCTVVARAGLEMPKEKNWRDSDRWQPEYGRFPRRMRYETAKAQAEVVHESKGDDYLLVYAANSRDLQTFLPHLPDPGPEPQWSKKNLQHKLKNLGIPESQWEEYAALEHFNEAFLESVLRWCSDWDNRRKYVINDAVSTIIRTGVFPDSQPAPTPDDGDSSYPRGDGGWGDGDDEEDEEDTNE